MSVELPIIKEPHPRQSCALSPLPACGEGIEGWGQPLQGNKPEGYWDNWLDRVTRKRNHQIKDGINKAAKLIIDHCLTALYLTTETVLRSVGGLRRKS